QAPEQAPDAARGDERLTDGEVPAVASARLVDPPGLGVDVGARQPERAEIDEDLPGDDLGVIGQATFHPACRTGADPAVAVEDEHRRAHATQRPAFGLRPLLALLRRALARFLEVRFDIGGRWYRPGPADGESCRHRYARRRWNDSA